MFMFSTEHHLSFKAVFQIMSGSSCVILGPSISLSRELSIYVCRAISASLQCVSHLMKLHVAPLISIAGKSREANGESPKIFVNYVINIVQNGRK